MLGDSSGIPADVHAYINDMCSNTKVDIYVLGAPTVIHLRQMVVSPRNGLGVPPRGYFTLLNDGVTFPASSVAGAMSDGTDFTAYSVIPNGDKSFGVIDTIPQYYKYLGYYANSGSSAKANHDSASAVVTGDNGDATVNYGDADEWWVTVYITPDPDHMPVDQDRDTATNNFGNVNPVTDPVVTAFRLGVSGSGDLTPADALWGGAKSGDQTITLVKNTTQDMTITLTGYVSGLRLPSPALTTWSSTGGTGWTVQPNGDGKTFTVTIPQNATGTLTVTAKAKDGAQTCTVTINVPTFCVKSSELQTMLTPNTGQPVMTLTDPVGGITLRHFFVVNGGANQTWAITGQTGSGSSATLLTTSNGTYSGTSAQGVCLSIPPGYASGGDRTITLTAGGTQSFIVLVKQTVPVTDRDAVRVGETFTAGGVEWRVLAKEGANTLVLAEHVLAKDTFHGSAPYPGWKDATNPRVKFGATNSMTSMYNGINAAEPAFATRIQNTSLWTRNYAYGMTGYLGERVNDWRKHPDWYTQSTGNKLFLLSYEEAMFGYELNTVNGMIVYGDNYTNSSTGTYFRTTGTGGMRTSGYHILFADDYAKKTNDLSGSLAASIDFWWLRSPYSSSSTSNASVIYASYGGENYGTVTALYGIRPACWVALGP